MAIVEVAKIQVRRGQENQTGVPQLDAGEFAWAQDTENLYIGKRISEGAADDLNTRILTEKDIDNIFSLLNVTNTATVITPYQYRSEISYIEPYSVVGTIQDRLDESVSLLNFGVASSFTATDITSEFETAVNTLFYNGTFDSYQRADSRRILKIPAGHFLISSDIRLPPYTFLEGEGQELTRLTLVNDTIPMFRTVDADDNDYASSSMETGIKRAKQISIKNMTLEYDPYFASNQPLIALDNVVDVLIENCSFRTAFTITNTTTFGLVNEGIGIGIRGLGGGIGSGDVNLAENIQIKDCKFDGLYIGVKCNGPVIRPVIGNNIFGNLSRGIEFGVLPDYPSLPGPSNGVINTNRFENVVREAIYVGENPSVLYRTNHVSENNFFIQTGNGIGLDDNITTSSNSTPIIQFNSQGNRSVNDYFHRRTVANQSTSTFYYAPLVKGRALVNSVEIMTATILSTSTGIVTKIPLTTENQYVSMKYQMYNTSLSRNGEVLINITPEGNTVVRDTYNYYETVDETLGLTSIYFDIDDSLANDKNSLSLICINSGTQITVEYSIDILV